MPALANLPERRQVPARRNRTKTHFCQKVFLHADARQCMHMRALRCNCRMTRKNMCEVLPSAHFPTVSPSKKGVPGRSRLLTECVQNAYVLHTFSGVHFWKGRRFSDLQIPARKTYAFFSLRRWSITRCGSAPENATKMRPSHGGKPRFCWRIHEGRSSRSHFRLPTLGPRRRPWRSTFTATLPCLYHRPGPEVTIAPLVPLRSQS
jgi:hypothetical protein